MTVKDKGKENDEEKVLERNPERELIAKKEGRVEGAAHVLGIRSPHFGLGNKEFKLRKGRSVPLRS